MDHDVVALTVLPTSPYPIDRANIRLSIRLKLGVGLVETEVRNWVWRSRAGARTASGRRFPPGAPRIDQ
jgi:hypothetical protein